MSKVYLAGPLFTLAERKFNTELAFELRLLGHEVWLPQDNEPRQKTAGAIYNKDIQGLEWSDAVVANMDGPDPDSGTSFEAGYGVAKGKQLICYRTDFRGNSGDVEGAKYNLMLWAPANYNIVGQFPSVYALARKIDQALHWQII